MSRVVVALGGNALIRRGEPGSTQIQRHNLAAAAVAIRELVEAGHEIVLTHGNGPQVGFLAIEAEMAASIVPAPPLDVLGAESQGQIGYLIEQALRTELARIGDAREIVTVLTQVVVDAADPAFGHPTKPVGPVYDETTARAHATERGWTVAPDGRGWRRVVPSPEPIRLVEAESIRRLVDDGFLVIAGGGGGVPVVEAADGRLTGVEGVIDKDLAAVVLALAVWADALLLLTDVDAVQRDWGTPDAAPISLLSAEDAATMLASGSLAPGSMRPKVEAVLRFATASGGTAAIGSLGNALATLEGRAGTRVVAPAAAVRAVRAGWMARPDAPRPPIRIVGVPPRVGVER